ncbi:MAG: restriction endonuclease [Oceanospirillaceae bacterium]|nr:restriction endonuclease [Oceanospirillaceae bacterium]
MAIPNHQGFMLPFLQALADGEVHRIKDLNNELAHAVGLTEEEMQQYIPSGQMTVHRSRIGWARTYLKKAGLIVAVKQGHFRITDRGRQLLATNPPEINNKLLEQYPEFVEFRTGSSKPTQSSIESQSNDFTPTEEIDIAFRAINSELVDELLDTILSCSPRFFEQLVVDLMLKMGYGGYREDAGNPTQYTNDGGIDGIINEDELGLDTIYLQAKRYARDRVISRPDVQSFAGALDMQRARKGVFITTSRFSKDACDFVSRIDKSIVLVDGEELARLMIKHNLGLSVKKSYEIKQIDTDYFSEE